MSATEVEEALGAQVQELQKIITSHIALIAMSENQRGLFYKSLLEELGNILERNHFRNSSSMPEVAMVYGKLIPKALKLRGDDRDSVMGLLESLKEQIEAREVS